MTSGMTRALLFKGLWATVLAVLVSISGCGGGGGNDAPSSSTPSYTIDLSAAPAEGGMVSGGGTYDADTQVTVSATVNPGYSFVNWSEGGTEVSTSADYTFSATADRTLVANFLLNSYTVSTSAGVGGSISPAASQSLVYGSTASFTITPDIGYNIAGVSGCNGTFDNASNTFTTGAVAADCTVSATFSAVPVILHTIGASASPAAGGMVSGSGSYSDGSSVTLTATANTGYSFVNWTEGGTEVSTSASYVFSATANRSLVANFSLNSYTVSTSASAGGNISPATTTVTHGNTTSFTVTPNTGYSMGNVTGCSGTLSGNTYTTGPVTAACTVSASFNAGSYTVGASAAPAAGGTVSGGGSYVTGASVTVTATANTGYTFINWTEGGTEVSTTASYTFSASADRTLVANFGQNNYTVSTSAGVGGSISLATATVTHGNTTSFTVTPDANYQIATVTGCGGTLSGNTFTTGAVTADCTVSASFIINSYTVSASAGVGGGISPVSATVDHGNTTSFTINPDPNYQIATVTGCGGTLSGNTYTTGAITAACAVDATFALPVQVLSFSKTSDLTLGWTTSDAVSCEISNDQNSEVFTVSAANLASGTALHPLPAATTFTLTCQGAGGTTATQSVTTVATNQYPETVGYYGSASSPDNSWLAIVNLTTPITFIDRVDFNTQVDSYCSGLGYIGAAKTQAGDFSVHNTYYLQTSDGIIAGSGPSNKVTLIPGDATFTNVYTNRRNSNTTNGNVGVATIGNNDSTIIQSVASPTSGANQMVLCQTDISFRNTTLLPQAIGFAAPGPIRKVQGIDTSFTNTAVGGLGTGAITYASSNPSVATVDANTGAVTLLALGTTTITATMAADTIFQQAQASYVLNFEAPLPIGLQSFTKTSDISLAWTTTGAASCDITNDQNAEVFSVAAGNLATGSLLHPLPAAATFTLSCVGEDGSTASLSATTIGTNPFPETVGYYGSASSMDNSWLAIVNLTTPITFTDGVDFNSQVDSYCTGLGYVGAAKTLRGDFSTHNTYYFQAQTGVISQDGPTKKLTLIPGDATFTNVYTNDSNSIAWGRMGVATIGTNSATVTQYNPPSPTSGLNQMVLCQTDIKLGNTTSLPQTIGFADPGPIRKVQGIDTSFTNAASGGLGLGAITYVSSDPAVATVDPANGAVTVVGLGTATITGTKAADAFVEAQASYTLTVDSPQPLNLKSFVKSTDTTLHWAMDFAVSCEITNDQNADVISVAPYSLASGGALHALPPAATFTLTCQDETGAMTSQSVTTVVTNQFPQTAGYFGSATSADNSWVAAVNLTNPITFVDALDFIAQVDSYCAGLGYVGVVKTKNGDFATHDTFYLHAGSFAIIVWPGMPSKLATVIPGDATLGNIYTNGANLTSWMRVIRTSIGNNTATNLSTSVASPTSGVNPMVLCQTDIPMRNTKGLPQTISFSNPGPIRKVQGLDASTFTNSVIGGLGLGAVTYVSSNPAVATVNSNGTVTFVGLGTTTITATKAADAFVEAQASYTLTLDSPQPANLKSFIKSTDNTLRWSTDFAVSCEITNNQNSEVITLSGGDMSRGNALHTLPAGATFTLTCQGEDGTTSSTSVSAVTNLYPQTVGYYGSTSSVNDSWVAIVNLTSPISYLDGIDFNSQVDNYCTGLGYVGVVKTKTGDFSTHNTYYLYTNYGIAGVTAPPASTQVTVIPGDVTYTNVYTNEANHNSWSGVARASIGNNRATYTAKGITGPTSGAAQMVLCQTDIVLRTSALLPQTISFAEPGPIRQVVGLDTTYSNIASGGKGTGAITYTSSNPSVATVDATTGAVTLVGMGTTTITATKAADAFFQQAQASYVLNFDTPMNLNMQSFTKTGDSTLAWSVQWAVSCNITNDQNSVVTPITLNKQATGIATGRLLHGLPAATVFTITCQGETGTTGSLVASAGINPFPQTVGYYGSANSVDNSWLAIVNHLTAPIDFLDMYDFNAQVDTYCRGLGYVGVAKTQTGDFSTHDTYYLHSGKGVTGTSAPSQKVTIIPGGVTYTNVFTNGAHYNNSWGSVHRASIGANTALSSITFSPTSGVNQMVLCQTDISFRETALITQTVSFVDPGPVFKTLGVDAPFTNAASGSVVSTPVTYVSSNPGVATVDANGTVTLVSVGTTTITATISPAFGIIEAQASYTLDVQ